MEEYGEYTGRLLADRYRLPGAPSDAHELAETLAWDTASGQEVLARQVPLPEVVDAEVVERFERFEHSGPGEPVDPAPPGGGLYGSPGRATRRPADPVVRRAVEAAVAASRVPDHPRLDQVFDVFVEGDGLWIVSELVPARPLAALLADRPLGAHRAAEIAADLLAALRVVHAHGWTHRNLTARTVLICEDGRALLTGLAVGAAEEALCGYDPLPESGAPPAPPVGGSVVPRSAPPRSPVHGSPHTAPPYDSPEAPSEAAPEAAQEEFDVSGTEVPPGRSGTPSAPWARAAGAGADAARDRMSAARDALAAARDEDPGGAAPQPTDPSASSTPSASGGPSASAEDVAPHGRPSPARPGGEPAPHAPAPGPSTWTGRPLPEGFVARQDDPPPRPGDELPYGQEGQASPYAGGPYPVDPSVAPSSAGPRPTAPHPAGPHPTAPYPDPHPVDPSAPPYGEEPEPPGAPPYGTVPGGLVPRESGPHGFAPQGPGPYGGAEHRVGPESDEVRRGGARPGAGAYGRPRGSGARPVLGSDARSRGIFGFDGVTPEDAPLDGLDGTDGLDGADGLDGLDGPDGLVGPGGLGGPGRRGRAGGPGAPGGLDGPARYGTPGGLNGPEARGDAAEHGAPGGHGTPGGDDAPGEHDASGEDGGPAHRLLGPGGQDGRGPGGYGEPPGAGAAGGAGRGRRAGGPPVAHGYETSDEVTARAARRGAIAAYREGARRATADRDGARRSGRGHGDGGAGPGRSGSAASAGQSGGTDWWATPPGSGEPSHGGPGGALDDDVRWLPSGEDEVLPETLPGGGRGVEREEIYGPRAVGPYGEAEHRPAPGTGPTALPGDARAAGQRSVPAPWSTGGARTGGTPGGAAGSGAPDGPGGELSGVDGEYEATASGSRAQPWHDAYTVPGEDGWGDGRGDGDGAGPGAYGPQREGHADASGADDALGRGGAEPEVRFAKGRPGGGEAESAGPETYTDPHGGGGAAPEESLRDAADGDTGAGGGFGGFGGFDEIDGDGGFDGDGEAGRPWGLPDGGGEPGRYRGPTTALAAERARHARMTMVGPVTERWAPEQAGPVYDNWRLAPPVGPAADLWALGALLFRAVQGHAPYPEDSAAELVQMVCAEPPAFAEDCGPLRPVVESLMRQDPTERPDFEELRGWLRSLIRSAPEPDIGLRIVAAPPSLEPGQPADPRRLPIVRRRGELVRRRRRRRAERAERAARPRTEAPAEPAEEAPERLSELFTEPAEPPEPRPQGDGGDVRGSRAGRRPRRLGRVLVGLVLVGTAGAVAYATWFMPGREDGVEQQKGSVVVPEGSEDGGAADGGSGGKEHPDGEPGSEAGKGPEQGSGHESGKDSGKESGKDSGKGSGNGSGSAAVRVPKGYKMGNDPAGFRVAVPEKWDRRTVGSRGEVHYNGGQVEMVLAAGRDTTAKYGKDPMVYQSRDEPELAAYRASDWATTTGTRRIDVGETAMAEGKFSWKDGSGREVYARNRAMILDGRYHVLLVMGSQAQKKEIDRHFEAVADTYRATR
ncbi:hypothetical protein [Streptomyces cacaoi]|uniref:hypothetical protein n=1 Tax=Streptomyces cacaoi TaxID=1898 RepID=UPI00332B05DC